MLERSTPRENAKKSCFRYMTHTHNEMYTRLLLIMMADSESPPGPDASGSNIVHTIITIGLSYHIKPIHNSTTSKAGQEAGLV